MVLTPEQIEAQRKRKISEAESKRMADIGTKKRKQIDALDLARARAKQKGLVAVQTPEGFEERTPEEAQKIPSVPEQERLAKEIKPELKSEVGIGIPEVPKREEPEVVPSKFPERSVVGMIQNLLREAESQDLSTRQAALSALTEAGVGAAAGTVGLLGGGVAGAITIPAGAIAGFIKGFKGNLKEQKAGIIRGRKTNLQDGIQNLRQLTTSANMKIEPELSAELFDEQMEILRQNYYDLKFETGTDLALMLSEDGTPVLMRYETFFRESGRADILILEMDTALNNPNPDRVLSDVSDVSIWE